MASPKALAAIALTLIVAMPLCLGYALASEQVESQEWESTNKVNLSDTILNSSRPFYAAYTDTMNNSTLFNPNAGDFRSPSYIEVSDTYTSIPTYENGTGTLDLGSPTLYFEYWGHASGATKSNQLIGIDRTTNPVTTGWNADIISMYASWTSSFTVTVGSTGDTIRLNEAAGYLVFFRNGDSPYQYYDFTYNGVTYSSTHFYVAVAMTMGGGNVPVTTRMNNYVDVSSEIEADSYMISLNNVATNIKLTTTGGSVVVGSLNTQSLAKLNDTVLINNVVYPGVTSIQIAAANASNTYSYSYRTATGQYANPAYGWQLPGVVSYYWTNTYDNDYVRMMIRFNDGNTTAYLTPESSDGTQGDRVDIVYYGGRVTVNNTNLGLYTDVMVEFTSTETIVTGLKNGWPSMGSDPQRYNSVTVDNPIPGAIKFIEISELYLNRSDFRVDYARILAGSYPSTEDYTLNMNGLFPGKSYSIKINSIGIYGDSLTIGSTTYSVTNGRIYVDGHSVPLRNAQISSLYNGTNYDIFVSGNKIGTSSAPASITFGGEWSLTLTADILEQKTIVSQEWSPGNFAFNTQESFSGALILAAAAAFIGIGLYGARSGTKIGLLLIVCGGVLLIAINLI